METASILHPVKTMTPVRIIIVRLILESVYSLPNVMIRNPAQMISVLMVSVTIPPKTVRIQMIVQMIVVTKRMGPVSTLLSIVQMIMMTVLRTAVRKENVHMNQLLVLIMIHVRLIVVIRILAVFSLLRNVTMMICVLTILVIRTLAIVISSPIKIVKTMMLVLQNGAIR
jgi:hypothetical protein